MTDMTATYAYCPGCTKENLGPTHGNAVVVANSGQIESIQKGHSNWAGKKALDHHLKVIEGDIPDELKELLVFRMLATSTIPLIDEDYEIKTALENDLFDGRTAG